VRGDVAVLPAGRTTVPPQKLITDETVMRLLDQARDAGRPVVVDGPPLGLFGDMLPVARRVDAVVLVVRLYHSRRRSLQTLMRQLASAGVEPLGVVVLGGKAREQSYYGA
jgi:Mrp family chromosome partitioning ATPase